MHHDDKDRTKGGKAYHEVKKALEELGVFECEVANRMVRDALDEHARIK